MKPTLLILAAGMGSRYGGLKQMDGLGPNGETIIDYSIYDAIEAGFEKIVFVIRKDIEVAFKEVFEPRFAHKAELVYAFQERTVHLNHQQYFREKPWGTAHAVLAAKAAIQDPFAVINADDYYGKDAFAKMATFLKERADEDRYAMIGYVLANTLSDYGAVSRGVCLANHNNYLTSVVERTKIERKVDGVFYEEKAKAYPVAEDALVSMNFWGFHPSVMAHIEKGFQEFILKNISHPKAEYYIPLIVNKLIEENKAAVEVIPTNAQWYGVTYKKDKPVVQAAIDRFYNNALYPDSLWG